MKPTEFYKINGKTETRYVLESASVGGTGTGAIASVSSPLGKVKKRDNILAQEEDKDPCWKGYKQLGTKKKKGRTVPNCVPKKEDHSGFDKGWGVAENVNMCRVCGQTPCNCTSVTMESAPPGFPEDLMMKLKKQYPGQPERAFATAWAIHKKKKSVSESSLAELQNEFEFVFNPKRMQLFVYPKGADTSTMDDVIAWIGLDYAGKTPDGEIMYASSDTLVQPKYHRRGIATAMYQYLRQHGVNIISSDEQTDKGAAMWQAFRKKGLAKDNKFLEDDYLKQLESDLAENLMLTNSIDTWKDTF